MRDFPTITMILSPKITGYESEAIWMYLCLSIFLSVSFYSSLSLSHCENSQIE